MALGGAGRFNCGPRQCHVMTAVAAAAAYDDCCCHQCLNTMLTPRDLHLAAPAAADPG